MKLKPNTNQIFSICVELANVVLRKPEEHILDGSNFRIAWLRILVGYKGEHIYQMLMPNGQIISYSNVDWIDNLLTRDTSKVKTTSCDHFFQHYLASGLFDSQEELKNQGSSEDILIPIHLSSVQQPNAPPNSTSSTTLLLSTTLSSPHPPGPDSPNGWNGRWTYRRWPGQKVVQQIQGDSLRGLGQVGARLPDSFCGKISRLDIRQSRPAS